MLLMYPKHLLHTIIIIYWNSLILNELAKNRDWRLVSYFFTVFGVSAFMHRQSPSSNSENNKVYRIEKYAGFSYINVTRSLVFRTSPLKYTIVLTLLSIFSILLLSLSFLLIHTPLFLTYSLNRFK